MPGKCPDCTCTSTVRRVPYRTRVATYPRVYDLDPSHSFVSVAFVLFCIFLITYLISHCIILVCAGKPAPDREKTSCFINIVFTSSWSTIKFHLATRHPPDAAVSHPRIFGAAPHPSNYDYTDQIKWHYEGGMTPYPARLGQTPTNLWQEGIVPLLLESTPRCGRQGILLLLLRSQDPRDILLVLYWEAFFVCLEPEVRWGSKGRREERGFRWLSRQQKRICTYVLRETCRIMSAYVVKEQQIRRRSTLSLSRVASIMKYNTATAADTHGSARTAIEDRRKEDKKWRGMYT